MNLAEAAQLILTLQLKDEVSSGLKGIQGSLDATSRKGATLSSGLGKIGAGIGVGIKNTARIGAVGLGLLWTQVDAGIDSLVELEDVTNQTTAAIKSTGGAAGLTEEDIRDLANELEELSGVDDKVIQSGENVLLTFTNIRKDAFEPAMVAALDLSERMDQDLNSSIVQIGKALNDPIKGMTALTRVGVSFSEEQKKVIEQMVKTGDTAGAQQLILEELNKEFGGSAQAAMEGYRGTQLRLKDTWEELQMTLAEALLPALDNLSRTLREKLMDPEVKEGVRKLGEAIAGLFSPENVKGGGDALKGLFQFLKDLPWSQIKDGLSFAAENAKKVVDVFRSLPPGVQAGLLTFLAANKLTGGLVTAGIGELLKVGLSSLKTITAGSVTVIGPTTGGGGVPGAPGVPGRTPSTAVTLAGVATGVGAILVLDQFGAGEISKQTELIRNAVIPPLNASQRSDANTALGVLDVGSKIVNLIPGMSAIAGSVNEAKAVIAEKVNGQTHVISAAGVATRTGLREIWDRTNHQTQVITGVGADHRQELRNIHLQTLEQKRLQTIGNHAANEAKERLASIQISSQRTAQKDLSVNMTVHTNLSVSGQSIANAIDHFRRTQGGQV